MKFYIKNNESLVEIDRALLPILEPYEVYVESNYCHAGDSLSNIMENLTIQKDLYTEKIKNSNEKSLYFYIKKIKVFTYFNDKFIFV